jgi:hypothetical protein
MSRFLLIVPFLFLVSLIASGCNAITGIGDFSENQDARETFLFDSEKDAPLDLALEASPDGAPDVPLEGASETTIDAIADSGSDTGPDTLDTYDACADTYDNPPNGCGGCVPLPGSPGACCGGPKRWKCTGPDSIECAPDDAGC